MWSTLIRLCNSGALTGQATKASKEGEYWQYSHITIIGPIKPDSILNTSIFLFISERNKVKARIIMFRYPMHFTNQTTAATGGWEGAGLGRDRTVGPRSDTGQRRRREGALPIAFAAPFTCPVRHRGTSAHTGAPVPGTSLWPSPGKPGHPRR